MELSLYIAAFFAGAFLANAVPHFVHGISGNKFPTPFSKPRGIGLSSAPVNFIWSLFNLAAGYYLLMAAEINAQSTCRLIVLFLGVAAIGIMMSFRFQKKHKEE